MSTVLMLYGGLMAQDEIERQVLAASMPQCVMDFVLRRPLLAPRLIEALSRLDEPRLRYILSQIEGQIEGR